jgi:hypothetical protein
MEKDKMITSENEVVKEYHVPELVDLNGINEIQGDGPDCNTGPGAAWCGTGIGA